jgi:hypothetical protein
MSKLTFETLWTVMKKKETLNITQINDSRRQRQ